MTPTAGKNKKYCILHGNGSHATEDCETLKKQVNRMKSQNDGSKSGGSDKKSGNWKKKASEAKDKAKDQFATFINDAVNEAVKKASKAKKRKTDSDDSSEGTLAAFEDMNLEDFDYDAMEKLVVGGNGEASC